MNFNKRQASLFFSLLLLSGCAVHRRANVDDWFKSSPGDNPSPQQHASLQEWGRWVHDPVKGWVADEWVLDPLRGWVRAVWDPQKGWVAQPPPAVIKREPLPEEAPEPPPLKPMVADKPEPEPQPIETEPTPKPMAADKPEPEPQPVATEPPPSAPVVVATVPKAEMPNKKENSGGFPPLAFGLMPVCAAALWMGGRAAVRATRG